MNTQTRCTRIPEDNLNAFACRCFQKLGVPDETARLAVRSLLDASLLGIDSHGIGSLDMYANHIQSGGPDVNGQLVCLSEQGGASLWDMNNGLGLSSARLLMQKGIKRAKSHGVAFITCRRTNHLGACSVYGKIAADTGMIGMVSQQTKAIFAPWGGKEKRVGQSPLAIVAPVKDRFPFCYDGSFSTMTYAAIKEHIRKGIPLPLGIAADKEGNPTTDPQKAWDGQVLAIGQHKGVGLAMAFEILHCVLSGNIFSMEVPSAVTNPEKPANTSLFMLVLSPDAIAASGEFAENMKRYVEYIASSPSKNAAEPVGYPGQREEKCWFDRRSNGIPITLNIMERLDSLARKIGVECIVREKERLKAKRQKTT